VQNRCALTIVTIFALSACAVPTASAENDLLPLGMRFKIRSGVNRLVGNGLEIKCLSDKGTGEITAERLGKFDLTLGDCTGLLGVTQ